MRIRPMRPEDVDAVERLTALAYPADRTGEHRRRWREQAAHLLGTDPGGCWVADDAGGAGPVVGVAISLRRDLLWILSSYAVHPGHQGRGIGTALLDAAVGYGAGCLRGMLTSLPDHQALRRYRRAGFTLYPTMRLTGVVDRSALPAVDGVRLGTAADFDLVDSVDRRVRGATHRPDNAHVLGYSTLLVCDLLTGSGYACVAPWGVTRLAATNGPSRSGCCGPRWPGRRPDRRSTCAISHRTRSGPSTSASPLVCASPRTPTWRYATCDRPHRTSRPPDSADSVGRLWGRRVFSPAPSARKG